MDPTERKLKEILFRHFCPTQMDLGEYDLGLLDAPRRDQVASHLQDCVHCQQDLVQIRTFLTQDGPARAPDSVTPSLRERVKVFVVNLLSPPPNVLVSSTFQPALRGQENEMHTQVYQVGPYLVALSFQKNATRLDHAYLLGDISPVDEGGVEFQAWKAHLWQSDSPVATVPLDADGHFTFGSLPITDTPYELILSGPDGEIHLQNLHRP